MAIVKKISMLIVEDDKDLLAFLNMVLLKEGYENVHVAHTLADALPLYKEHKIDVVFIDIVLPDGDGLDLAKSIRSNNQKVKLILMSSNFSPEIVSEMKDLIDGFLAKPFQTAQLLKTIDSVLKN